MKETRKCSVCGKQITEGYVFDGIDCFCSKECAANFFDDDEGCVEILIDEGDRLIWHDEFPQRNHFRVNIGHYSPDCFHHFDNEQTMFRWINEKVGEEIHSFDDCEAWTRKQDDEHGSYIEILCLGELKEFYENRRAYVQKVHECEDAMTKAQRKTSADKKSVQMARFAKAYDEANWYREMYPEVWQGEI